MVVTQYVVQHKRPPLAYFSKKHLPLQHNFFLDYYNVVVEIFYESQRPSS